MSQLLYQHKPVETAIELRNILLLYVLENIVAQ